MTDSEYYKKLFKLFNDASNTTTTELRGIVDKKILNYSLKDIAIIGMNQDTLKNPPA